MRRSDFAYGLPEGLIAQAPLPERDQARLLQLHGDGVAHRRMSDFAELLRPDDLVVVNNTRVVKARLRGIKDSGGAVELLLERIESADVALCHARSSKPLKANRSVAVGGQRLEVLERDGQFHRLRFPAPVLDFLEQFGETPLPPYISRAAEAADRERYQTVFATAPGAVAAPTAACISPVSCWSVLGGVVSASWKSPCTSAPAPFNRCAPKIWVRTGCIRNATN